MSVKHKSVTDKSTGILSTIQKVHAKFVLRRYCVNGFDKLPESTNDRKQEVTLDLLKSMKTKKNLKKDGAANHETSQKMQKSCEKFGRSSVGGRSEFGRSSVGA